MKSFYCSFFTFILIFFSTKAFSQNHDLNDYHPFGGRMILSAQGGYTLAFTDYDDVGPGNFGRLTIEYFFQLESKSTLGFRIFGGIGNITGKDTSKIPNEYKTKLSFVGAGLTYSYYISDVFVPQLFVGVSNVWYDPKSSSGQRLPSPNSNNGNLNDLNFNVEGGVQILLTKDLSMNLNAGYSIQPNDNLDGFYTPGSHHDLFFVGAFGISYSFFGEEDSDGDGVIDSKDECPNTPANVKVDEFGCPLDSDRDGVPDYLDKCPNTQIGIPVSKDGCPLDSDGDGVPDYLDSCPNTPLNVAVDSNGCPFDSDGDGIPDYLDNCKNTPKGIKVDKDGCPEDLNNNGVPDYLEKKEAPKEKVKIETPKYNIDNEVFVTPQILTDGKLYVVQLSSWKTQQKADRVADRLKSEGHNAFVEQAYINKFKSTWYRVRVGYFNTFEQAKEYLNQFKK